MRLLIGMTVFVALVGCGGGSSQSTTTVQQRLAPTANAGVDQTIDEGAAVELRGEARAHPDAAIRRVSWHQRESDAIRAQLPSDSDQNVLLFSAPQVESDTTLAFIFRVEDSTGRIAEDQVTLNIRDILLNQLPIAQAGPPQTIAHDTPSFILDGCDSRDPDGDLVAFLWQAIDVSPAQTLGDSCQITVAQNTPPAAETVSNYRLTVRDNQGATAQAQTQITKSAQITNAAPVIERVDSSPRPARPSETVTLNVIARDADDNSLSYQWTQRDGEPVFIARANTANAAFEAPAMDAMLTFNVSVSDGVSTANQTLTVRVSEPLANEPPSLMTCLTNPAAMGCFPALKQQLARLPGSETFLDEPISAGRCNPAGDAQWPHFTGLLHEHTAYSDGFQLTKPADVYEQAKQKGWSFAISTDHSDNIGLPFPVVIANDPEFCATNPLACVLSDPDDPLSNFSKWDATLTQAQQASSDAFTAMRGFEWTSDRFGHANVLFSQHYINPKTGPGYVGTMEAFWAWFVTPAALGGGGDGMMVFNHPGREDALHEPLTVLKSQLSSIGLAMPAEQSPLPDNPLLALLTASGDPAYTFNDFRYVPSADYRVVGVEVFGKGDEYDTDGKKQSWFAYALDKGWYLSPTGSEDHHDTRWGDDDLPKTVLIARTVGAADLREAMLARRAYAVAQNYNHLLLDFTVEDAQGQTYPMGSRLKLDQNSVHLQVNVRSREGSAALANPALRLELMSSLADNDVVYTPLHSVSGSRQASFEVPNNSQQQWAFIRVREGERIVAVSAPIWFQRGETPWPVCQLPR